MRKRLARAAIASLALSLGLFLAAMPSAGASVTYRVQLDARPPTGEPWAFLRFFPKAITVHQGDVIDAAWGGTGAPHTATLIPSADPNAWRVANQGPPGPQDPAVYPYALQVLDTSVGGDDGEVVLNPAVAAPSAFGCGDATTPCGFDGTSVVSSGFLEPSPGSQPSFSVQVNAPAGQYSFVCLLHPGMQEKVTVVAAGTTIPSPQDVADQVKKQVKHAREVDAEKADAQAQEVTRLHLSRGRLRWTINAGGFDNNVSADEFVDRGLKVHVGDEIKVLGNYEIHTATFPKSSAATVPFIMGQCEVTGPDTPATAPTDCASPTQFEVAFNPKAVMPTASNELVKRSKFVNSGLIAYPQSSTFVAKKPGKYTVVCLVHGPTMSTTITVA